MRALVTGASGFTGTHLLKFLQAEDVEVFTHGPVAGVCGTHYDTPVFDPARLASVVRSVKPDYVFHLAGLAVAKSYNDYYLVNVLYAANMLKALEETGQSSVPVLLVGTSAEYGIVTLDQLPITEDTPPHPYSHYGISKLAQTQMGCLLAQTGRPLVMVRPFNIIGTGMREHLSVYSFTRQVADIILERKPPVITVGNLAPSRDFMDVKDVINAYWRLIQTPDAYGKVFNLCTGRAVKMSDLLRRLIELAGVRIEVRVEPAYFKLVDIPEHYGNPSRLHSVLGFSGIQSLEQSLQEILEDFLAV